MNRIDRIAAILIQLQSKRIVTAQEIAERFEISIRTVYRDIRTLEEAGVPIGAEAGVGYYLMPGYCLPPVQFTKEEAGALLIGEKFVEKMTDSATQQTYRSAMFKIKSVLPETEKDFLEQLNSTIAVQRSENFEPDTAVKAIEQIQRAIADSHMLSIEYTSQKGDVTKRTLEPVGLIYYMSHWHLIGYCKLRNDYRDFRSDRISSIAILKERFNKQNRLTLNEYLTEYESDVSLEKAVLTIKSSDASMMDSSKYYFGYHSEERKGATTELTFYTSDFTYFAHWVISFTNRVSIVSPSSLLTKVRGLALELSDHYSE
ncbi:MAG: YafY family transcriptional regulator [Fibrobacterales bacterium]